MGVAIQEGSLFVKCDNPGCLEETCRLCQQAPHKDQTCEEAKAEKDKTNAHARVALAMNEAVMRSCPKCQIKIVKSTGCNKMVCTVTDCKTKFCYLCRKEIADYKHFCQTPHCTHETCGKCVLFGSTEEADKKARRDAALKEQSAIGDAAKDLKLLTPSPNKRKRERTHPVPVVQQPIIEPQPVIQAPPVPNPPAQEDQPARTCCIM